MKIRFLILIIILVAFGIYFLSFILFRHYHTQIRYCEIAEGYMGHVEELKSLGGKWKGNQLTFEVTLIPSSKPMILYYVFYPLLILDSKVTPRPWVLE